MKPKLNYKPGLKDNCQTPWYAIEPIIPYLQGKKVWEPADGDGMITNYLVNQGISTIGTDISRGMDFFDMADKFYDFDCIVTNPPYSIKQEWVSQCYAIGKPFALLMPIEILGTRTQLLFDRYGIQVMFIRPRVDFYMPNLGFDGAGSQFPTAWFTWNLDLPVMSFVKLNKPNKDQVKEYYK